MNNDQLSQIAIALETKAGASTSANAGREGYWKRIAAAAEAIALTSTIANQSLEGFMLRTALALEGTAGTSGAEETAGYSGYLKRIVDALEVKAGAVGTSDITSRFVIAAANATFGAAFALFDASAGKTTVVDEGGGQFLVTKTSGVDGDYDASALSSTALTGDFIFRLTAQQINKGLMFGVNADPNLDVSFTGLDFAVFFADNGVCYGFQNGAETHTIINPYTAGMNVFIKRVSGVLSFGYGGTDGVTGLSPPASGGTVANAGTLYVDSSFRNTGAAVRVKRIS